MRSAACFLVCAAFFTCLYGAPGAAAQRAKKPSEPENTYQRLKSKWDRKRNSGFTIDELRQGVERFWTLRKEHPGTEVATQATIEAFRLLDEESSIFVERDSTSVRLMKVKYNQIGLNEPAKARVLKHVPSFTPTPFEEWRRVAERSETSSVRQAALFQLARRHHRRSHYDRTEGLLDTLSTQFGVTEKHPRYGNAIRNMRREIERLAVGTPLPPLRAPALAGDTIDTAAMHGTVRLLFFYGSHCGSCVQKYPILNRLYETYDRKHLRLIGIPLDPAVDYGVSKGKYPTFMEKYGIEWPQTWSKKNLFEEYNVGVLGTTMLLNQNGTLVWLGQEGPIDAVAELEGQSLSTAVASLVE